MDDVNTVSTSQEIVKLCSLRNMIVGMMIPCNGSDKLTIGSVMGMGSNAGCRDTCEWGRFDS